MDKKELKILNTIRGIAALLVVISHYSNGTKLFDRILGTGGGQVGVMIFFVLSGFLISYLYLDKNFTKKEISNYLVARVARVIPLFYFIVLVSYLLQYGGDFTFQYKVDSIQNLLTHLLLLNGVSILWTIPVEIQYYILFISIWGLFYINRTVAYFLILGLSFSVFYFEPHLDFNFLDQKIDFHILKAIPFFLTGLLFGKSYAFFKKLPKSRLWGISIVLVLLVYPGVFQIIFNQENSLWYSFSTYLAVIAFFFTWVFMIPEKSKIFSNDLGDFLGKISYSMYLFHFPILLILKTYLRATPLLMLPIYLSIVIGMSYLSYRLIENPARQYIKKINI